MFSDSYIIFKYIFILYLKDSITSAETLLRVSPLTSFRPLSLSISLVIVAVRMEAI